MDINDFKSWLKEAEYLGVVSGGTVSRIVDFIDKQQAEIDELKLNIKTESKRKRHTVEEMYHFDVHEIAKRILQSARSYENIEEYSKEVALSVAMNDYSFWYNGNEERLKELEELLHKD